MKATIKQGDEVILRDVDVSLQRKGGAIGGWSGSFRTNEDHKLQTATSYRLVLADGRSGDIIIELIQLSGMVYFVGSEALG